AYISSSNISFIRDDLSFQSTAPFEFVADKYLIVWWEHYFDGFFFNRIPGFNKLHLREFIQCKAMIGSYGAGNAALITLPSDIHVPGPVPYVEVGAGIENILNLFQVGFYWRCTYRNTPNAANFGVKLNISPGF
ncbi:MAG: TonB-linked outer membrane protein SusC/RagA family, partial [Bacteroidota bacterium]|nr:TonB-linked outer membrane protein SusC/RagA family [Bacteroidota bacterium]